jgi:hypothetical protein
LVVTRLARVEVPWVASGFIVLFPGRVRAELLGANQAIENEVPSHKREIHLNGIEKRTGRVAIFEHPCCVRVEGRFYEDGFISHSGRAQCGEGQVLLIVPCIANREDRTRRQDLDAWIRKHYPEEATVARHGEPTVEAYIQGVVGLLEFVKLEGELGFADLGALVRLDNAITQAGDVIHEG